jgi:uncharacterized protein (TIGR03086 family)
MQLIEDLRALHGHALARAASVLARVEPSGIACMSGATPCAGWDLGTLLGHMLGQNHGFAAAIRSGEAPLVAYSPRPADPQRLDHQWRESTETLRSAIASAPPDRRVLLVEIGPEARFPLATVIGFHLLDTVVHTWDVATALGVPFRPTEELVHATLAQARRIPDGPTRLAPGAAFAPPLGSDTTDDWRTALALLGRREP